MRDVSRRKDAADSGFFDELVKNVFFIFPFGNFKSIVDPFRSIVGKNINFFLILALFSIHSIYCLVFITSNFPFNASFDNHRLFGVFFSKLDNLILDLHVQLEIS